MLANWVRQSTSTTGTGDIVLDGAPDAGFIAFSTAFRDGQSVNYIIEDGNNREEGIGVLTAGTNWTLVRSSITATLENGTYTENPVSGITLSGNAIVGIVSSARNTFPFIKKVSGGVNGAGDGYRFSAHLQGRSASTSTTIDRVEYIPFVAEDNFTISGLGIEISVAGSTNSVGQMGVYSFDINTAKPINLLAKTLLFPTDVTGNTIYSLDTSIKVMLGQRLFFAFLSNGGPSVHKFSESDLANGLFNPLPWRARTSYYYQFGSLYEDLASGWSSLPVTANSNYFLLGKAPAIWASE